MPRRVSLPVDDGDQPSVLLKNGIRSGFTSQTTLAPELRIGVVVLTSSDQDSYTGYYLSSAVFYDLYFRCLKGADFCPPRRTAGQTGRGFPSE